MMRKLIMSQVMQNPFSLKAGFGWLGVMGNVTRRLLKQMHMFDWIIFSPDL